ncbi:MAG: hypothetical protein LBK99_04940 [Opitutaceae bacterium]|nr:hypothetical protein [Opitutaceae bacterium]
MVVATIPDEKGVVVRGPAARLAGVDARAPFRGSDGHLKFRPMDAQTHPDDFARAHRMVFFFADGGDLTRLAGLDGEYRLAKKSVPLHQKTYTNLWEADTLAGQKKVQFVQINVMMTLPARYWEGGRGNP